MSPSSLSLMATHTHSSITDTRGSWWWEYFTWQHEFLPHSWQWLPPHHFRTGAWNIYYTQNIPINIEEQEGGRRKMSCNINNKYTLRLTNLCMQYAGRESSILASSISLFPQSWCRCEAASLRSQSRAAPWPWPPWTWGETPRTRWGWCSTQSWLK